jgi:hypothetical protein
VVVEWETASEVEAVGFYVYRAATALNGWGEAVRLNAEMVAAQWPGSPVGGRYGYLDGTARPGVTGYYWLEAIDVYGTAIRYGPAAGARLFGVYLPVVENH